MAKRLMIIFFMVFLGIYGSLNFYCFWKLRAVVPGGVAGQAALGAFIALMTCGPILVRILEHAQRTAAALALALTAYFWMAALLWFVFLAGAADAWNIFIFLLRHAWPAAARLSLPPRPTLAAVGVLVALATLWGLVEAQWIRLVAVRIRSPHLAPGKPLRILQISDVHLGLIERGRRLNQILRLVRRTQPDLIVSTGDLVDGTGAHLNTLYKRLAAVRPPLGKFAVTGNHEFYAGIEHSLEFTRAGGFRVLRGETIELDGGRVRLAGVDDPTSGRLRPATDRDEPELLGPRQAGVFTILLKHQPRLDPASLGRFDLMLSGHTHRGQILPFGLVVRLFYPYLSGTHELGQGSLLHINRGTGTWGPPLRLGAPPEVTLITIEPAAGQ